MIDELLKKMQIKAGETVFVLNLPEELRTSFLSSNQVIAGFPQDTTPYSILIFVKSKAEIKDAAKTIKPETLEATHLWFAYPKKSSKKYNSEITRDTGWNLLGEAGFEPVRQISISDDWSGLRFRKFEEIKKFTRNFAISSKGLKQINK
jgi:hypothetical protein